jgi:hypothetical protein
MMQFPPMGCYFFCYLGSSILLSTLISNTLKLCGTPAEARLVHVGFVVDEVGLGQVLLRVLRFYPVNIVPP